MIPEAVHIEMISHFAQRYPTVGDWWISGNRVLQVRVSRTSTPLYGWLIAIHETIEAVLCCFMGVDPRVVDAFDRSWEQHYQPGDDDEPGDSPAAPYHTQHVIATLCERLIAFALGVDWQAYEKEITALWQTTRASHE